MQSLVLAGNFRELSHDELYEVNGGIGFIGGLVIGVAVSWVADGILLSTTGKSGGEWVSTGINAGGSALREFSSNNQVCIRSVPQCSFPAR